MKAFYLSISALFLLLFNACESDIQKTMVQEGTAPKLASSPVEKASIVLTKENDSINVLSLTWTTPDYLSDTKGGNVLGSYTVQIDSTDNFLRPTNIIVGNVLKYGFTGYELNQFLVSMKYDPDKARAVYIRVRSEFFSSDTLISDVFEYLVTPYSTVIPPAIEVPDELYITGDALLTGWVAPFLEEQKFTKTSETVFTLDIDLKGNNSYELISDGNGVNWTPCYRLAPDVEPANYTESGTFVWDGDGSEYNWTTKKFLSPAEDARYRLVFDFQTATYTVTNISGSVAIAVPDELYITGDALPGGWVVPFPSEQKFTKTSETVFTLTISLLGSKAYELVTDVTGENWTPCYRLAPDVDPADYTESGTFVWDGEGSDYNWTTKKFLTPSDDATYTLTFDFQTTTYQVLKQ